MGFVEDMRGPKAGFFHGNSERSARKCALAIPVLPIANAPSAGLVRIRGRVLPSEQGIGRAPLSGREVIWYQVELYEHMGSGTASFWQRVLRESVGCEFLVDDGSGQPARVRPGGATADFAQPLVAECGGSFGFLAQEDTAMLDAFLAARGLVGTGVLGFRRHLRCEEQVIVPGDVVCAMGQARWVAGQTAGIGYGAAPTSQLWLGSVEGPDGQLYLTDKTDEQMGQLGARGAFRIGFLVLFILPFVLMLLLFLVILGGIAMCGVLGSIGVL